MARIMHVKNPIINKEKLKIFFIFENPAENEAIFLQGSLEIHAFLI